MFDDVVDFVRSIYGKEGLIPLHEPLLIGNEKKYLNECIDSTFVSSVGEFVDKFEVKIAELANLAHENNIPLIVDLGSGSIADYKYFGLPFEKMINEYVKSEADIISFSGDKLLGGPQAGILVGKKHLIKIMK